MNIDFILFARQICIVCKQSSIELSKYFYLVQNLKIITTKCPNPPSLKTN